MHKLFFLLSSIFLLQACATSYYSPTRLSSTVEKEPGQYAWSLCENEYSSSCITTLFNPQNKNQDMLALAATFITNINATGPTSNRPKKIYIQMKAWPNTNASFATNKNYLLKDGQTFELTSQYVETTCPQEPCNDLRIKITSSKVSSFEYEVPETYDLDGATLVVNGVYINNKQQPPLRIKVDYRNFIKAKIEGKDFSPKSTRPIDINYFFGTTNTNAAITYGLAWANGWPDILPSDANSNYIGRASVNGLSLGPVQGAYNNGVTVALFNGACFNGLTISLLGPASDTLCRSSRGIYFSAFSANGTLQGINISAMSGMDRQDGLQLTFLGGATEMNGVQFSALASFSQKVNGIQIAPTNIVFDKKDTKRWSHGLQLGLLNVNSRLKGLQLGVFNAADNVKGSQIGLLNSAASLSGVQLGLVNIIESNKLKVLPVLNISWK